MLYRVTAASHLDLDLPSNSKYPQQVLVFECLTHSHSAVIIENDEAIGDAQCTIRAYECQKISFMIRLSLCAINTRFTRYTKNTNRLNS